MSSGLPPDSLLGKRKRKKNPDPNPLFSQWLAEWRDEAREKGWKSEYIYSKALKSLKKYPLPLSTGKECKILQHFGDKICKMIDDRLLQHKQEQVTSASDGDLDAGFSAAASGTSDKQPTTSTVHEISDASDEDGSCLQKSELPGTSDSMQGHDCSNVILTKGTERKTAKKKGCEPASSWKQAGLASRDAFETVEVDDDDDDVTFLGQTSMIHASLDCDDDDNDLPELPRLPDLNVGHEGGVRTEPSSVRPLSKNDTGGIDPAVTANIARVTPNISDSDGDESGHDLPPQKPGGRAGVRQAREYMPAYRSGPYAVLLTLFRQAQDPNFRGFMTKAELCRAAQPLADRSFTVADPGSRYTAWSSVSILIRKGYLTKESSPAKYRLTDEGYTLAHRLEEVERKKAAEPHNGGDTPDGPDDGPGGGGDLSAGRGDIGPLVTDPGEDMTEAAERQCECAHGEKRTFLSNEDPDIVLLEEAEGSVTNVESDYQGTLTKPQTDECVFVDECDLSDDGSDDDDELPPITLPSLADRLKPTTSTSVFVSRAASEDRRLRYWYVAEDDQLVTSKDRACVEIEDTGMSFLVKINYQDLLQGGCQYKLDMTRPVGDDFVFAYLPDEDCYEEALPPLRTKTPATMTWAAESTVPHSTTAVAGSSTSGAKPRQVHEISDSDSDSEQVPSTSDVMLGSSGHGSASSYTSVKPFSLGTKPAASGAHSSSAAASSHRETTAARIGGESADAGTSKIPREPTFDSAQDSVGSGESTASSAVEDFVLWPGTFEVVLCVDNREFYGSQSSSKSLLPDLIKNGVTCDLRLLNVGDLLWVAREKVPAGQPLGKPGGVAPPVRRELVLSYVVERKRMDDLVSSMIGGRLKEQKFRLKHCGLQEKIILIESYGSMEHFSISEDRIKQAIANTEIIDGFTVKQTKDSKETAVYLTLMTRYLQSYYQSKTLRSCSRDTIRELGIRFNIKDSEQMLMPFDHFNQASLKTKPLTIRELFAKQLIQLWGMSAEKAKAVVDKYPTPSRLFDAYAACTSEKERDSLLANLKHGKNQRNLGIALSRQVALLYNSTTLT